MSDVCRHNIICTTCPCNASSIKPYRALAELCYRGHIVAYEQQRSPGTRYLAHFPQAFFLELRVAHGKDLIDEQYLRLKMCCDRERQAHVHAGRISFHRRVKELLYLGESNDLVELPSDLGPFHSENGAIQIYVLPSRQFRMKACPYFTQAGNPSYQANTSRGWLSDAAEYLEER